MNDSLCTAANRIAGALLGLAAGAATAESRATAGDVWSRGSGDVELAAALARTYAGGYSLRSAADAFLASLDADSSHVDPATCSALERYRGRRDPRRCALVQAGPDSAEGALLARCLAVGLVRTTAGQRMAEAAEVAALTHPLQRCVDSCIAYCEVVASLLRASNPVPAVVEAGQAPVSAEVRMVLAWAPRLPATWLCPSGGVLNALTGAVWALCQPGQVGEVLEELVGLGADRATSMAAGGLLGAARGLDAVPQRLVPSTGAFKTLLGLAPPLLAARLGHSARPAVLAGSR